MSLVIEYLPQFHTTVGKTEALRDLVAQHHAGEESRFQSS